MPIYMDRHDVSEQVTAENVAQLHQEDLKIQTQFGCNALTYWFDDKRKMAFCLIEAPDEKTLQAMHNTAHGEVPNNIIEVDPGVVESFLGRIEDPKKAKDTGLTIIDDPAFRAIMVITIDQLLPKQNGGPKSLTSAYDTILTQLKAHDGNLVKQSAGYFLASFGSASGAVRAALAIQSSWEVSGNGISPNETVLKIGLSTGVPVTENKNLIFEDAIKLAERMSKLVKGEIIVSSDVRELYDSENTDRLSEEEAIVSLSKADEKFLTHFLDYTEATWKNADLKVGDFSKPIGLSKSQLYRKLTSLTGKSPNTFIHEYRLREALILLNKNVGNVSEIAFETGFSSPSYFSKCFQKRYGYLPSDYLHT